MAKSIILFGSGNGIFYGSKLDDSCEEIADRAVKTAKYVYGETYMRAYYGSPAHYEYFRHKIVGNGVCSDRAEILDYVPRWFK